MKFFANLLCSSSSLRICPESGVVSGRAYFTIDWAIVLYRYIPMSALSAPSLTPALIIACTLLTSLLNKVLK